MRSVKSLSHTPSTYTNAGLHLSVLLAASVRPVRLVARFSMVKLISDTVGHLPHTAVDDSSTAGRDSHGELCVVSRFNDS